MFSFKFSAFVKESHTIQMVIVTIILIIKTTYDIKSYDVIS